MYKKRKKRRKTIIRNEHIGKKCIDKSKIRLLLYYIRGYII